MTFSTLPYLFLFLPLVFLLYYLLPVRSYRNAILLVFSLIFYCWGEPRFVIVMLCASLVAYIGGLFIDRFDKKEKTRAKKAVFITTVSLLVINLLVFKYLGFFAENLKLLFGDAISVPSIVLPIGISFYTFQILSYVFDLYKKEVAVQKNFFYLTLYVTFFPQLIAGPIVRYQTVEDEINGRREDINEVAEGLRRFTVGLAKKAIISNNVVCVANAVYGADSTAFGSALFWLAAISYTLHIYFDFSGYSDMAIGLGRIFGFHFLENFNYPYIATSVTDFWRRWHISLSTWFRDYIYIPLGGNRKGILRHIRNILIVWALTGFWHGASWNFVMWGLYYGILLLLEKFVWGKLLSKLPKVFGWIYTMFIVIIGWVMFNLTDFAEMTNALYMMFSFTPTDWTGAVAEASDLLRGIIYMPLGIVFMFPIAKKLGLPKNAFCDALLNVGTVILLAVSVVYITSSSYNPFIYFRF